MSEATPAAARNQDTRSEQAAIISRGMVTLMRDIAGRGPERARTTIGRDHVLVMFRETLTQGERHLVEAGKTDTVQAVRAGYQDLLQEPATKLIEETLYRKVIGFMSANHFEPDMAAEVFILDPQESTVVEVPQEAEHAHRSKGRSPRRVNCRPSCRGTLELAAGF